jgi:release factor glutamine methyltransferase
MADGTRADRADRQGTHPDRNALESLVAVLSGAGFVAADDEAVELLACAGDDPGLLALLVDRRMAGEPLAWIVGGVTFCGRQVRVDPGVYVPRWQSEPLAHRSVDRLLPSGVAVDVCTGAGAMAMTLGIAHPAARIVATDICERAVACAISNGVDARPGDLFSPLPPTMAGSVDLVVGVVPYVPTVELARLPRDTLIFESAVPYDGGTDGTDVLRRVLAEARHYLRPGGALLLELGGDQAEVLGDQLDRLGYADPAVITDDDGDVRGIEAIYVGTG